MPNGMWHARTCIRNVDLIIRFSVCLKHVRTPIPQAPYLRKTFERDTVEAGTPSRANASSATLSSPWAPSGKPKTNMPRPKLLVRNCSSEINRNCTTTETNLRHVRIEQFNRYLLVRNKERGSNNTWENIIGSLKSKQYAHTKHILESAPA